MKMNTLPLPMQYKILKRLIPYLEFTFEVSVTSNDITRYKIYIFEKADNDTGEIKCQLISADSFVELLNKIEEI